MNNKQIYWLCQIGGWFFYWIISTMYLLLTEAEDLTSEEKLKGQIGITLFIVIGMGVTHSYRLIVKKFNWITLPITQLIFRLILSIITLSALSLFSYILLAFVMDILPVTALQDPLPLLLLSGNIALIISLWIVTYFSTQYFRNYRKSQVLQLKHDAAIKEVTLNKLRSQLNPHFIFNSLNSIRALVNADPEKARNSITALANIFRKTLQLDKLSLIPFREELQIVEDYLHLEQIRFEERLTTHFEIDEKSFLFQVPPMMLQTLVENGIKHGISTLTKGGNLRFITNEQNGFLVITIENDGIFIDKPAESRGFGIQNTRERLLLLYEGKADFSIENIADNKVRTILTIPKL